MVKTLGLPLLAVLGTVLGTAGCFSSSSEGDAGTDTTASATTATLGATTSAVATTSAAVTTSASNIGTSGTGTAAASTGFSFGTAVGVSDIASAGTSSTGSGVASSNTGGSGVASFGTGGSTGDVGVSAAASTGFGFGTVGSAGTSGATGGSTTGGGLMVGSYCVLPQSGATDPCFAVGLTCVGPSPLSATGTCQLPPNGYACELSVGCAAGNDCYAFPGYPATCYQPCTDTTECAQTYDSCQAVGGGLSFCIPETCGPGSEAGGEFYEPCNVEGVNDGFCVPFSNAPNPDYGLCIAGAPVDAGVPESCVAYDRSDGGELCPVGMFCYTDYETTGTQCQPYCGVETVNGAQGPGCAAGQFCVQSYGAVYGSCAPTCPVPDESSACSAGENCLVTGQLYGDGGAAYTCEP